MRVKKSHIQQKIIKFINLDKEVSMDLFKKVLYVFAVTTIVLVRL